MIAALAIYGIGVAFIGVIVLALVIALRDCADVRDIRDIGAVAAILWPLVIFVLVAIVAIALLTRIVDRLRGRR